MTNKAGYPDESSIALGQMASGDGDLSSWYCSQFVQNETMKAVNTDNGQVHHYLFEKTPILAGTTTATVYVGDTAVQTFSVSSAGKFTFTSIGEPMTYAVDGNLKLETGELELRMCHNTSPELVTLVASYEYHMDASYKGEKTETEFDLTDMEEELLKLDACDVELGQGRLLEMFITTRDKKKRRILLKAIKALDDVLFDVLEKKPEAGNAYNA
jgi:hypothetical protein